MRFVTSKTFPSSGHSIVYIENKKEIFRGEAKLYPGETFSELTGCRYAQERAEIKALKKEYKEKKAACEECRKFVVAVQQYANFNPEDPSARAMFRQLNRRIREVNKLADEINKKEFNLQLAISQQDSFEQRIAKND